VGSDGFLHPGERLRRIWGREVILLIPREVLIMKFCLPVSLTVALAATPGIRAQQHGDPHAEKANPTMNIVETAQKAGSFQTLLTAAKAAGLVETLSGKGPLTVFAPTDDAFAKLPKGTVEALLKDKEKLAAILTYHVVAGSVPAAKLVKESWQKTVNGQSFQVMVGDDGVMVDGARVTKTDIVCNNGRIHVIDSVILPRKSIVETAVEAGKFNTLVTAVKAAKLDGTLSGEGPFTVFAPTDAAFAKLPDGTVAALLKDIPKLTSILTYHVVPGRVMAANLPTPKKDDTSATVQPKTVEGRKLTIVRNADGSVMVDGAKVTMTDIVCGNGVIHVIDAVVMPK
jgi:uncharacterized surface protein with fasciclin (FAS1) repeats